jgi:hypothetical protein
VARCRCSKHGAECGRPTGCVLAVAVFARNLLCSSRVQSADCAVCRLPRKPPLTLCGLRCSLLSPIRRRAGLASLCAYLLARPDKGLCCIVSVSYAHCSSSNLHSSLLLTTLSLETLEPHSTHSRLALLLHACPPTGLVTASPPP